MFEGTAWKNGTHQTKNVNYTIRFTPRDRDEYFDRPNAFLILDGNAEKIEVNTDRDSFWNGTCIEVFNKEIGIWLKNNGKIPWERGCPPKLELEPELGCERTFKVAIKKGSPP